MDEKRIRETLKDKQRIVYKIGSSSIIHEETGGTDYRKLETLVLIICGLKNQGKDVVLVSSGAIGVGFEMLGLRNKPKTVSLKQACAAIGQGQLMMIYQKLFAETAEDPVASYQLSFKLKTSDLKIQKVDEYGNAIAGQNAVYYLGWKEDPERQYHSDSLNDLRWRNNHGDRVTKDDADGQADQVGKERLYYPLLNGDSTTVRRFASDAGFFCAISSPPTKEGGPHAVEVSPLIMCLVLPA